MMTNTSGLKVVENYLKCSKIATLDQLKKELCDHIHKGKGNNILTCPAVTHK